MFNAIMVKGDAIGDVMFYGRGAGKLPTASAVVADVMDAARHIRSRKRVEWTVSPEGVPFRWYVRCAGTAEKVRAAGLDAALLSRPGAPADEVAFLTRAMPRGELMSALSGMELGSLFRVLE